MGPQLAGTAQAVGVEGQPVLVFVGQEDRSGLCRPGLELAHYLADDLDGMVYLLGRCTHGPIDGGTCIALSKAETSTLSA
jgi:hypothetical protein